MAVAVIGGLFLKAAGWVLTETAKNAVKALSVDSPLGKAISSTGQVFPAIEGVEQQLRKWCESGAFQELFEKIKQGDRHLTDDAIIDSFVEVSGFYSADDTKKLAGQILEVFAHDLYENLYTSDKGLTAHANREEVLHAETRQQIQQFQETFTSKLSVITESLPFLASDDLAKLPKVQEKILHVKIDQARDLRLG